MGFRFFLVLTVLFSFPAAGQVTKLSVSYSIGYDCSEESGGEDRYKRGSCYHEQRLDYDLKRKRFRVKEMRDLRLFREYKGGFLPNSVMDSLHVKRLLFRRRLPASALERLLAPVVRLESDSILRFNAADFSSDEQLLSAPRDSIVEKLSGFLDMLAFSTVTAHLNVSFELNGVSCRLHRDSENHFWTLYRGAADTGPSFINTELDAFFTACFPKSFYGSRITSNNKLEKVLSGMLNGEIHADD